ncbi:MAG: hypothetical protein NPIRA03_23860 [Nitrospirales bacterium]|nr:MAG: hypothetical protein NPIRA03_23860 [Nitrospirales bacterium]
MPHVTQQFLPLSLLANIVKSKLLPPFVNIFVDDRDSALGKQYFRFTEAEVKPVLSQRTLLMMAAGKR